MKPDPKFELCIPDALKRFRNNRVIDLICRQRVREILAGSGYLFAQFTRGAPGVRQFVTKGFPATVRKLAEGGSCQSLFNRGVEIDVRSAIWPFGRAGLSGRQPHACDQPDHDGVGAD